MPSARHFCPAPGCGSISVQIQQTTIIDPEAGSWKSASCPDCGWEGKASETVGALTSEKFFDIQDFGDELLATVIEHAAGPIYQVFVKYGILDPSDPDAVNAVMQAAFAGMVERAFQVAAEQPKKEQRGPGRVDRG